MFLNQIFVTPSEAEADFKHLQGLFTKGKVYVVYAVGEEVEKLLVANDQGKLSWEYFGRFRVTQSLTRVIDQNAISDQIIELAQQKAKEEPKENPLLAPLPEEPKEETEVKQSTKKGAKNG